MGFVPYRDGLNTRTDCPYKLTLCNEETITVGLLRNQPVALQEKCTLWGLSSADNLGVQRVIRREY